MRAEAAVLENAPAIAIDRPIAPAMFATVASVCAVVGMYWDVSWHESVGRDSFFTYPHALVYVSGFCAGIASAWLVARGTFGGGQAEGVKVWGMRGPVGAFLIGWGALVMLASAPFDNFWHEAYGLDAHLLSPPHVILDIGLLAVETGALAIVCAWRNAVGRTHRSAIWAVLLAGMLITGSVEVLQEPLIRIFMHSGMFYRTVAFSVPLLLVTAGACTELRFGCTLAAGLYSVFRLALLWVLPLFPAHPRLAPVLHLNPHFVGPEFPLLILVPAIALDLLRQRGGPKPWPRALRDGSVFFLLFLAVQWPFADFLVSPAARNALFGGTQFGFSVSETSYYFRGAFKPIESEPRFWINLALAWAISIAMVAAGRGFGRWLATLRR